ncbi:hypothetical protein MA16_Dca012375 [Dendrobium catenatum]|uniref:Polyprotein n=1 Tax=Dendrobium catenatum TaxID=906689 RepID=A0A2I0WY78_9ASPA|nr:hypothetical protein MA16_Dca012375 [Dendrobium catenatum]
MALPETVEDQIRGYRLRSRIAYELQRRLPRRHHYQTSLESQLDPEAELQLSQRKRANLVPAETLYEDGWTAQHHRVYQHYTEERVLALDEHQVNLPFIRQQSYQRLLHEGMQHIHLGLIMVRVQTLHRRDAGTTALIVLRDTRWRSDVSIIGTMEIDLSSRMQLVYIAPNLMIYIHDFLNHIELVIMAHGYEEWQGGESNLLITRALVARLTTSQTGFRYNIIGVANYLASHDISAIPRRRHAITELQGRSWHLRPSSTTLALLVPHSLHTH